MSEQPATPAPDAPLEQRVGKLESGQQTLSGKLDTIIDKLSGGSSAPAAPVTTADPAPSVAPDMTEQMAEAIRRVNAEAAAKSTPAVPEPEQTPREITVRGKEKLQHLLFGKEPQKR
jgi:hypothetical protein